MIRKAVLIASCFLLTSCGGLFNRQPVLPTLPPSLCTNVRPEPVLPSEAGLVAPADEAERTAYRAFLNWTAEVLDWGRENTARAETAKKAC